jgi:hypothetical protein
MSANAERYDNPETADKLEAARKELERRDQAEQTQEAATSLETRQEIADEDQPDPGDAPDLRETYTVDFRGHPFDFFELGDSAIEAAKFAQEGDDVEAGSQAADFVYETLGEKAVSDDVDEAYWRGYDFDDVIDLFFDLVEESSDIDEEDREKIDEFRGE